MITREAIFLLRETKKLVIRKENMRKNVKQTGRAQSAKTKRQLPMLETNYGLHSPTLAYIFNCSVFGFDTILSKLQIAL